ncbi:phage tail sheath C-terminal domain-containing protein [Roseovarius sp. Pro17]|uniref:phage tail sheath C-terminal domain-containing protein n=1 Tax=Roseovarius sp. Pro17 TaxID=3108175 RepID=UPI002D7682B1|nr:phage tail sheath C-terminal domain-containing protein [Roseovarius sp. Pro17]
MTIKTPGVYVVEKSAFPNSIVQVATAIPAFIGYTEEAMNGNSSLAGAPTRLTSMAEFHSHFGFSSKPMFKIVPFAERTGPSPLSIAGAEIAPELPQTVFSTNGPRGEEKFELVQINPAYALYGAMRLFFQNGGGACYVTSIGSFKDEIAANPMIDALTRLEKEPEPTIIVIPDVIRLSHDEATKVQQLTLKHCGSDMKNRFAILDIPGGYQAQDGPRGQPVARFRDAIGTRDLDYGAAYYPWLNSSIYAARDFDFQNIEFDSRKSMVSLLNRSVQQDASIVPEIERVGASVLRGDFTLSMTSGQTVVVTQDDISAEGESTTENPLRFRIVGNADKMTGKLVRTGTEDIVSEFTQDELKEGKISFVHDPAGGTDIQGEFGVIAVDANGIETAMRKVTVTTAKGAPEPQEVKVPIDEVEGPNPSEDPSTKSIDKAMRAAVPLYVEIMNAITAYMNTMPPSAAMAGIYTAIDNSRGVWKAPANVSLSSVVSPTVVINHEEQENLNVSITGKSINAIRPFVGQGTLVWGARTLNGNSLDWRYINVRRTMIMLEESIRLASKAYVFEPNTATTWVTLRSMIENFLTNIWKQGGLAGSVSADAFSVHVGLGDTMTPVDILDGILRISVLVAVVRPAEFIEFTFEQEMQKS